MLVVSLNERPELLYNFFLRYAYEVSFALSILINIVLAVLIVSRLVYHQRYDRNTLGVEHGSPYTNIITMCVESCALIVIFGGLFTGLYFGNWDGVLFMNPIIPHIFVGGLELNNF